MKRERKRWVDFAEILYRDWIARNLERSPEISWVPWEALEDLYPDARIHFGEAMHALADNPDFIELMAIRKASRDAQWRAELNELHDDTEYLRGQLEKHKIEALGRSMGEYERNARQFLNDSMNITGSSKDAFPESVYLEQLLKLVKMRENYEKSYQESLANKNKANDE